MALAVTAVRLLASAKNITKSGVRLSSRYRGTLDHVTEDEFKDAITSMTYEQELAAAAVGGHEFDLLVIGGGSGGLACAKEATRLGAKVAVVDYVEPSPRGSKWGLGGTCLNVGCIPKKLMHYAAGLGDAVEDARCYGWDLPEKRHITHDWVKLKDAVQNHIKSANWLIRVDLRDKKMKYYNGHARFVHPTVLRAVLKDGFDKFLTGKYIVIAVGGRPKYPEIPGALEYGITSDDIFSLPKAPGKTLVVGAGYIGLECAGFLNGLGYNVTVMVRSIPLRGFDQQMAQLVCEDMARKGVKFYMDCTLTRIDKDDFGRTVVHYRDEERCDCSAIFETVLFAIGRHPVTEEIDVAAAGIEVDVYTGKIITKDDMTNVPNIYALGDVVFGRPELTPVAIQAGKLLANRLFKKSLVTMDYKNVATTVFTPLEYGTVGLNEQTAIECLGEEDVEVYHAYYKPTEFVATERNASSCYLKVVCQRETPQQVLGMHYVGPNAGEVIQGFAAAVKAGISMDVLKSTMGIHPTTAEEFTRLSITKRSRLDPKPQSCCS